MKEPNEIIKTKKPIKYLSVCSGMEAASVAWHPLGWEPVGFSEIEPFPCEILKQRFPNTPNYGDLTKYPEWPIQPGTVDVLVGGTPCQSYSVAGKRGGLNDPRGQLMLSFLDLADRIKPKWIIWENVPGVLSSNGGRDFGSFLGALGQLGYGFAYRVLDAQFFGVPQRRRRVFVVASLGGWRSCAEVLSLAEGVRGNLASGGKKRKGVAADAGAGVEASRGCWWDGGQVSQTLDAVLQKGQTMPEKNRFPAILQPKPMVIDREQTNTMNTIVSRGPHAVGVPHVAYPVIPLDDMNLISRLGPCGNEHSIQNFTPGDPSFTLRKGGSQHGVLTPMAVRRLTPIECERLQGFPDNWSRISWKGNPPEECPDGPRYKACGNSMAVPVMRWIGERIEQLKTKNQ